MILTCPECATRYFVDPDRMGAEGRMVRCSQCATSWRARAGDAAEKPALDLGRDASAPVEAQIEPPAASSPLPRNFRDRVQARRRTREAVAAGVVWAGLAAVACLLLIGAALFRVEMVRLWPATAGAYAAVRLPVNPTGFVVEGVQGGPGLQDGRLAMVVSGAQRNVETAARSAPALRVALFDHGGRRLLSRLVPAAPAPVAPGETRGFRVSFLDPPAAASEVHVDVAFDAAPFLPRPAPRPAAPATGEPPGLVRVEVAKPLPANSAYALHPPARS